MSEEVEVQKCKVCGGRGYQQIVLQAGPNPCVSPPLDCPNCNGGEWELWEELMPQGWNRGEE